MTALKLPSAPRDAERAAMVEAMAGVLATAKAERGYADIYDLVRAKRWTEHEITTYGPRAARLLHERE